MSPDREQLIHEFQGQRLRLIAYIRSLVGDVDQAEDIFQEVSVVVLEHAQDFQPGASLQAWCRGIARNLICRRRVSAHRMKVFDGDRIVDLVDQAFRENDGKAYLDERRSRLRHCIERLAPKAQECLNLRYSIGLSLRNLAEKFRQTEGAVQVTLSRIRKTLTDCVSSQEAAEGTGNR